MGEREGQNDYLNELGEEKKAQNFSEKKYHLPQGMSAQSHEELRKLSTYIFHC